MGAYRKNRVIDTAASEVLRGAQAHGAHIKKIYLIDKHIEFCTNCRTCAQEKDVGLRGKCMHNDNMEEILREVDSADGLVLAAPTNLFNPSKTSCRTTVTRRFLERLLVYANWPWQVKTGPRFRTDSLHKKAVTITATACPAWLDRQEYVFSQIWYKSPSPSYA